MVCALPDLCCEREKIEAMIKKGGHKIYNFEEGRCKVFN